MEFYFVFSVGTLLFPWIMKMKLQLDLQAAVFDERVDLKHQLKDQKV